VYHHLTDLDFKKIQWASLPNQQLVILQAQMHNCMHNLCSSKIPLCLGLFVRGLTSYASFFASNREFGIMKGQKLRGPNSGLKLDGKIKCQKSYCLSYYLWVCLQKYHSKQHGACVSEFKKIAFKNQITSTRTRIRETAANGLTVFVPAQVWPRRWRRL
jgi:hypothetical protein